MSKNTKDVKKMTVKRDKMASMTPDQRREYNRLAKLKTRKGPVYKQVCEALQAQIEASTPGVKNLTPYKPRLSKIGVPPTYDNPEVFKIAVEDYFTECEKGITVTRPNKRGELVTWTRPVPYTIAGLIMHLGFTCREAMGIYLRERPGFADAITYARTRIEQSRVCAALTGDVEPKIAALDLAVHFGYNPEKRIEINNVTNLSEQELDAEIDRLEKQLADLKGLQGQVHEVQVTDIVTNEAIVAEVDDSA